MHCIVFLHTKPSSDIHNCQLKCRFQNSLEYTVNNADKLYSIVCCKQMHQFNKQYPIQINSSNLKTKLEV